MVAVDAALKEYTEILASLVDPARGEFQRSNGLKMEQLKAELSLLVDGDENN